MTPDRRGPDAGQGTETAKQKRRRRKNYNRSPKTRATPILRGREVRP
jgi:hypothetical protein